MARVPEIYIEHMEVLVHPEYNQLDPQRALSSTEQDQYRKAWHERCLSIKDSPHQVLLYFSSFLYQHKQFEPQLRQTRFINTKHDIFETEKQRIRDFRDSLGNRFFLFPQNYLPDAFTLERTLAQRDLFTDSEGGTSLAVYGELHDRCVKLWAEAFKQAIGYPENNDVRIAELSISSTRLPN